MSISLKQLEAFVAIVDMGSFENAANYLYVSQSAISKRVQELENELKEELFDRTKRKTVLTIQGERLYYLSLKVLDDVSDLNKFSKRKSKSLRPVRVGVTELTSLTWLPKFLNEISENYKDIQIDISIELSRNLYQLLEEGSLDLIVIPEMHLPYGFTSYKALDLEICFFCKKNYVNDSKTPKLKDLMNYPFIFQGRQSFYSHKITKWLREQGVSFTLGTKVDSLHAMMGLVLAGRGFCISPIHYFKSLLEQDKIVRFKTDPELPKVEYHIIFKDSPRQNLFKELSEIIIKIADFRKSYLYY